MKPTEFHAAFARALEGVSPRLVTLDETASTMDDARTLARDGAPHLAVVVADHQTAGRGRLGRGWVSPRGTALAASWVVRPSLPPERWTILPLLTGVAAVRAIRHRTKVPASLKWPNDLRVGERKVGGILAEAEVPRFVVIGLGLNVSHTEFPDELRATATSIAIEDGVRLDRADLLAWTLRYLEEALGDPDAALGFYRRACTTLGAPVRVERIGAPPVEGTARDVDDTGALLVETADGTVAVASGDVEHLRATLPLRPPR